MSSMKWSKARREFGQIFADAGVRRKDAILQKL